MWVAHSVAVAEVGEALADPDAMVADPDPTSRSKASARVIGYSRTVGAVLVVIVVRREDRPGACGGPPGWRAGSADRRIYRERNRP